MAVSVTGSIRLLSSIKDERTAVTGATNEVGVRNAALDAAWLVASGTAAGLADKVWSDTRVVTTGATDSLDLAGTLTDAFGSVVTFVKIRAIIFSAASTNTTTLTISRVATAGVPLFAADGDAIAPLSAGGFFCWADPAAGLTVTATTDDILSIVNSAGASATYSITVVGTSA